MSYNFIRFLFMCTKRWKLQSCNFLCALQDSRFSRSETLEIISLHKKEKENKKIVMNFLLVEISNFKCFLVSLSFSVWRETFNCSGEVVNTNVAELRQINYKMIRSHFPRFVAEYFELEHTLVACVWDLELLKIKLRSSGKIILILLKFFCHFSATERRK